ncbi:fatty acyl-CoA reductase 1-like [Argiope bruennichi]|uniref:fatty acyl-CoA reductase 1-like n=1 Tax=Argiope bruennichi TaxID=94029 RepID=UPI002495530D|nr:fatty acyl-CoA reductase 1-like [Argiope bruennichi]XP_055942428.1 fatty acyl-CoA reductase 1-like [Argiope bruennichi]
MLGLSAEGDHLPRVADYYHNKSIFITGASGFVGSVLLETLLRCCPGIKAIYILLRSKKNVTPEVRIQQIFSKKIFDIIKEENQEQLNKVHVISGDITLSNLGMSEEDTSLLLEEVSMVFHCAANLSFTRPMKYMFLNVVLSLNCVIELCRRMKKFEALVFTSTAYTNCNHLNRVLKEDVYRLPFRAEKFLDAFKNEDDGILDELVAQCKPDWPNNYTFCKCVAENLIMDTASDLPIVIMRPSIIVGTLRNPMPGYQEDSSGISALTVWVGKGFLKVLHADPNSKMDLVPVDIVSNALVLSACYVGSQRCASPVIFNCTSTEKFNIKISEYAEIFMQLFSKYPVPQAFADGVKCEYFPNKYVFYIARIYNHFLPAIAIDVMRSFFGKKPRVYSSYRFFDQVMNVLHFFMSHTFYFDKTNTERLNKLIHPEDRKNLELDFEGSTLQDLAFNYPTASPFYDWKIDTNTPSERQKIKYRRHLAIIFIKAVFLIILCAFISWIFSKIIG